MCRLSQCFGASRISSLKGMFPDHVLMSVTVKVSVRVIVNPNPNPKPNPF